MQIRSIYRSLQIAALLLLLACHSLEGTIYKVQAGEDAEAVAQKFAISKDALLKANPRLKTLPPALGERILIPQKISRVYVPPPKKRGYVPVSEQFTEDLTEERVTVISSSIEVAKPAGKVAANPAPEKPALKSPKSLPAYKNVLRFAWPSEGKVVSGFGKKDQKMHNGIDIRLSPGGEVKAAESGRVVFSGNELQGYGNLVILRHQPKVYSVYAYLGKLEVKKGDDLKKGELLGRVGKTSSDSFYHFEIRQGKQALDPIKHLPGR